METTLCRGCQRPLSPEAADPALRVLACERCGAIFERRQSRSEAPGKLDSLPLRKSVALPEGLHLASTGARLKLTRSSFRGRELVFIPLSLIFLSFVLVTYGAVSSSNQGKTNAGTVYLLFGAVTLIALLLAYRGLVNLTNTTHIEVTPRHLKIWQSPLPWPGGREMPVETIDQLYCVKRVYRSKHGYRETYELRAIDRQERSRALLKEIDQLEQVLWLEQEIEVKLGIRDLPVKGEFKPS